MCLMVHFTPTSNPKQAACLHFLSIFIFLFIYFIFLSILYFYLFYLFIFMYIDKLATMQPILIKRHIFLLVLNHPSICTETVYVQKQVCSVNTCVSVVFKSWKQKSLKRTTENYGTFLLFTFLNLVFFINRSTQPSDSHSKIFSCFVFASHSLV